MDRYELIEIERSDGFAIVAFNRPQRMNAILPQMLAEFDAAMAALDAESGIEVVILTGRGRNFCAGLDVDMLKSGGAGAIDGFTPSETIANWRGPVIAAVQGAVATGGFEITVACDLIIAAESTRFVDTHSRVGLLPGWGLSARLHRAIGIYRAKELELTGRPLHAREAADWGLVNRVVPDAELLEAARAMARMIVSGAPGIAAPTKALIDGNSMRPLGESLKFERAFAAGRNLGTAPGNLQFDHVGRKA
ncbi:enoyl-CoA hydratase-related protein [Sphingomonas colocasiae]|uniref:Enoyl-CoA hydratase/isomerase family protein n=1 Tax=Sphingomonas colocasiae TaxID=1848973 RepID=A0ABS7PWD3_9SPHN|nr:enoyl-CoA hydratase-related protein [Sphingomonas colocasiae]MBY8824294.1 enoyl-CoA hydratase/isomerase family protein [Sphingomonas colocasiae]